MRRTLLRRLPSCVALLLVSALALSTLAQSSGGTFTITSQVVAGGGCGPNGSGGCTTSAGSGNLIVEGTAGQSGAGALLAKPPYSQIGGFWPSTISNTPTAAPATISGQVTTPDGSPLGGVVMRLSGPRLATTITSGTGAFRFAEVDVDNFYTVTPSLANYHFAPLSRSFSLVGNLTDAVFTGNAEAASSNAIDTSEFFVRQQYLDFLDREPDQGGFEYWSDQINRCHGDADCIRQQRLDVSAAFFVAHEFQESGGYVYRLYRAAFGERESDRPAYEQFAPDRALVVGGPNLQQGKLDFASLFVQRAAFAARYPQAMTAEQFVDAVLSTVQHGAGVTFGEAQRESFINDVNAGGRALMMKNLADSQTFLQAPSVYNRAFVLMQYFGYLRRDPDQAGYDFWVNQVTDVEPGNYRGMVCAFLTSAEYQLRFSSIVTRSNAECRQ